MSRQFGERIQEVLNKRKMSQKELAMLLGITEATMSRYISGDREPKPDVLASIATALHVTSDFLLDINNTDFDQSDYCQIIARNAQAMTREEKRALINALLMGD